MSRGLGFRVWGLVSRGLGFRAWGLGLGAWGWAFMVWGLGFRVRGLSLGRWVSGFGCRACSGLKVKDFPTTKPSTLLATFEEDTGFPTGPRPTNYGPGARSEFCGAGLHPS